MTKNFSLLSFSLNASRMIHFYWNFEKKTLTTDHENTSYPSLSFACPFIVFELNLLSSIIELVAAQILSLRII